MNHVKLVKVGHGAVDLFTMFTNAPPLALPKQT